MIFIPEIVTGVIIILCGLLVKAFPDLIAGFSSLSDEAKKNIDVKGLSSYFRYNLISLGSLVIILGIGLKYFGIKESYVMLTCCILIMGYILVIAFKSKKFYKN